MEPPVWKIVQKKAYDLLSHRYGLLLIIGGLILIIVSAFHFGETLLEWSQEKYAVVFNSYSDNIAGRSYRERLCLPVPIDVVYTWVNGSDPHLVLQLRQIKLTMEKELNITKVAKCTYSSCVKAPILVLTPMLPTSLDLAKLKLLYPIMANVTGMFNISNSMPNAKNNTALRLTSWKRADEIEIGTTNHSIAHAHYTSDSTLPHAVVMADTILMTGFPHKFSEEQLLGALPSDHAKNLEQVELHADKGVAVLHLSSSHEAEALLQVKNFTIEGKTPTFTKARLVWDLTDFSRDEDVSNSRFEDNEELRYSLRSLEKFAPWVRHIYIVTNGQIPYWLNLDNPRVSIVTHEEIFLNASHLPTFSSPAIEANLHRIPGLSDKFIYFNDDVMFGKEVWPDDFFSFATGQKLYLTWPVPSCNEGCPSTWIRDGYCDKACNSSDCDWDGGDCVGKGGGAVQLGAGFHPNYNNLQLKAEEYCHSGCANSWIADKYCDQACNHLPCGFDAGDCGTDNFYRLHSIMLQEGADQHYEVPAGESLAYFNLTQVLGGAGKIISAKHKLDASVRVAAVSNKFHILSLILYPGHNATQLKFYLVINKNISGINDVYKLNFTVSVNTKLKSTSKGINISHAVNVSGKGEAIRREEIAEFMFEDYPKHILSPQAAALELMDFSSQSFPFNISGNLAQFGLSPELLTALTQLLNEKAEGHYTQKGFKRALASLHQTFLAELSSWRPQNKLFSEELHLRKDLPPVLSAFQQKKGPFINPKSPIRLFKNDSFKVQAKNADEKFLDDSEINHGQRKLLGAKQFQTEDGINRKKTLVNMAILGKVDENLEESDPTIMDHDGLYDIEVVGQLDKDEVPDESMTMSDEAFIDFVKSAGRDLGWTQEGLPWEERGFFDHLQKLKEDERAKLYESENRKGRHLMDTFGESLRHVNRLYNKQFGFMSRKVPAHMPHMIDKNIMAELQAIFPHEWEVTSSHRIRSPDDMQFAFSYYYYLLGALINVEPAQVFDEMDTDHSGILSDREIRTLATRFYELPLYLETLTGLEQMFINCSENLDPYQQFHQRQMELTLENEEYYDKNMPQVTRLLFTNCTPIVQLIKERFKSKPKYKTRIVDDLEVAFKMIQGNVSKVVGQLDDVRKNPKKFVCLNDNIEHGTEGAKTVKAVIQDFYESILPVPSQFELPREYRNRFLHIKDLEEWKRYRDWLRLLAHIALVILVIFAIVTFFGDKMEALERHFKRQRQSSESDSSKHYQPLQTV